MAIQEISFLPAGYLERKVQRRLWIVFGSLFLVVAAGIWAGVIAARSGTRRLEDERANVDAEYRREAEKIESMRRIQVEEAAMSQQAEATASLMDRACGSYLLAQITNALPDGVMLTEFDLASEPRGGDGAADSAGGVKRQDYSLRLTGLAQDDVEVAKLFGRLTRSTLLAKVNLAGTEDFVEGDQTYRRFTFEMGLNPDAPAPAEEPVVKNGGAMVDVGVEEKP